MAMYCKVGDVFRVKTTNGYGYFQFTFRHPAMGHLIRVFSGQSRSPVHPLKALVFSKEAFFVYFPLQDAIRRKGVEFVANCPVPLRAQGMQPMRRGGLPSLDGGAIRWSIFDGKKTRVVKKLGLRDARISIDQIINLSLLIERIEKGWKPEMDS